MKKFISMVMAAAMVVSLVPATAFAGNGAYGSAKVIDVVELKEDAGTTIDNDKIAAAEVQIKITGEDYANTDPDNEVDVTLMLDGAEFLAGGMAASDYEDKNNIEFDEDWFDLLAGYLTLYSDGVVYTLDEDGYFYTEEWVEGTPGSYYPPVAPTPGYFEDVYQGVYVKEIVAEAADEITITFVGEFAEDDVIAYDLAVELDHDNAGFEATVAVDSDICDMDATVFAKVLSEGIKVTLKKVAEVAEEDETPLERDLTIETVVGSFVTGQKFELKLSKGFEFAAHANYAGNYTIVDGDDDDEVIVELLKSTDKFDIRKGDLTIDAVSAKADAVGTITVKALKNGTGTFKATATAVDAVKVLGDVVTMSVDEKEDVPVFYSGVNVDNYGLTDDADHVALEVTIKESTKGAFDFNKAFTLTLPEGVFATNVKVTKADGIVLRTEGEGTLYNQVQDVFKAAYKKGEHDTFEVARKTFYNTDDSRNANGKKLDLRFEMTLIAVPGFTGDVTLKLAGDGFENEAEVVIAKFEAPYTVEAAQNDLIIDYRNTEVPTAIVVKEAEAGLWDKDEMAFAFEIESMDKGMDFENDATFTVNEESEMEVKAFKNGLGFTIDEESDEEAAVVTISGIELYMSRSLAAGAYDLELSTPAALAMMTGIEGDTDDDDSAALFTTKVGADKANYFVADYADWDHYMDGNTFVWISEAGTVKEGFINVITAGRDQDDASFTTKVVVPVGEAYLIAGENTVALDVPAYINAAGYTMLPVRAVATALGIDTNNVLWSQAAKQVTILYGQRIITMTVGQSVIYVNGSAIPASAAVEVVDGRAFLGLRDLANALGVTNIGYDAATKTATLN